jgi:hypothetical protein
MNHRTIGHATDTTLINNPSNPIGRSRDLGCSPRGTRPRMGRGHPPLIDIGSLRVQRTASKNVLRRAYSE